MFTFSRAAVAEIAMARAPGSESLGNSPYSMLACDWHRQTPEDDATMPTAGDPVVLRRLKSVETKVDRLTTDLNRMATNLAALEVRLGAKIDVQLDDMRDVIRKFAEGLGGRLDAIAQQLVESNKNWEAKFSDHDLAIRDHTRRISSLEQSR